MLLLDDCDLFAELMSRSADYYVELFRRAVAEGIDILYPANEFAYDRGLFVRPVLFAAIWRSHYERMLAPVTAAGMPTCSTPTESSTTRWRC